MSNALVDERVTRGIELLDKHDPDWRERIDWSELRMDSCSYCVLGQLYAHYVEGLERLGLGDHFDLDSAITHGFNAPGGTTGTDAPGGAFALYDELAERWKALA